MVWAVELASSPTDRRHVIVNKIQTLMLHSILKQLKNLTPLDFIYAEVAFICTRTGES
jgi:hypothetical protein